MTGNVCMLLVLTGLVGAADLDLVLSTRDIIVFFLTT